MIDNIRPIRPDPNVGTQGIDVGPRSNAYRAGFVFGVCMIPVALAAVVAVLLWVLL